MDDMYYLEASLGVPVKDIFRCILKMIENDSNGHISKLTVKEVAKIIADCKKQESYPTGVDNSFDLLVDDVIEEIMLQLDRASLANLCFSSKRLSKICNKTTFKTKYDNTTSSNINDWLINQGFPDEIRISDSREGQNFYMVTTNENDMMVIVALDKNTIFILIKHDGWVLDMSFGLGKNSGYLFRLSYWSSFKKGYYNIYCNTDGYVDISIDGTTKRIKFDGVLEENVVDEWVLELMKETGLKKYIIGKPFEPIKNDLISYIKYISNLVLKEDVLNKGMKITYNGNDVRYDLMSIFYRFN